MLSFLPGADVGTGAGALGSKRGKRRVRAGSRRSAPQSGCHHTSSEAAGCLLLPGAVLLFLVLQLSLILELRFTGYVAAVSLTAATAGNVVCDAEGAVCVPLELDAPPTVTERDLGIGHFAAKESGAPEVVVDGTGASAEGPADESGAEKGRGGSAEGGPQEAFDTKSKGLESEGVVDETRAPIDGVRRSQVQTVGEEAGADGGFCGDGTDSGRGQCEWGGGALRMPGVEEGWALLCTLVPESELQNIFELAPGVSLSDESSTVTVDASLGQELQIVDATQSTRPPRVAPIGLDEYRKAALQQQGKESEPTPNASEVTPGGAVTSPKRVHPEGPRFNYASVTAGAKVVAANKEAKGQGNVLDEDKDKYLRNPCSVDDQWVVIELTQDTRIDTVVLSNYEFYSSGPKNFSLFGSQSYPIDGGWTSLGEFTAQNVRTPQSFELSESAQSVWVRYLLVKLLSHYGAEFYCTLSLIRVHGTDALESFREELVEAMRETGVASKQAEEVAAEVRIDEGTEISLSRVEGSGASEGQNETGEKVGGGSEAMGLDDLFKTPAALEAVGTKDESSSVSGDARGVGDESRGVGQTNRGKSEGEGVPSESSGGSGSNQRDSSQVRTGGSDPTAGAHPVDQKAQANVSSTETGQAGSTGVEEASQAAAKDVTPAPVNSTSAVGGVPTSNGPAAGGGRASNGRPGGEFILKVLLQRLKGLEANASLFEGYVSETQQHLSQSLNELDAEIEGLAGRLNGTAALLAKLWGRLQSVDEARVRSLESRHDLMVAQTTELASMVAQLRQSVSELVFATVLLSCLCIMLLVAQCCRCRMKQD